MLYQYLFLLQQLGPDRPELHRRGRDGAGAGGLSSQVAVTHAMAFRGAALTASVALAGGHGSLLGQKSIPLYKFKITRPVKKWTIWSTFGPKFPCFFCLLIY